MMNCNFEGYTTPPTGRVPVDMPENRDTVNRAPMPALGAILDEQTKVLAEIIDTLYIIQDRLTGAQEKRNATPPPRCGMLSVAMGNHEGLIGVLQAVHDLLGMIG